MISRSTPYTSFPSFKEYLHKDYPVPVSHLAHLLSDDLELYDGNNNQLKSIQRNRLNFFDDEKKVQLADSVLTGLSTSIANKAATDAEIKLRQQKQKERKQIMVFATGIIILVVVFIVALKFNKS